MYLHILLLFISLLKLLFNNPYETPAFENFMVKVNNTFADESILNEKGDKPDFDKFKPVLFEMPGYTYLKTGDTIGKCMSFGKNR